MDSRIAFPARVPAVLALAALAGCGSLQAYEGDRLPPDERATVRADPSLSAGLPVEVILRRVNRFDVPVSRTAVELPPGLHRFVVDCRVREAGVVTRFVIDGEVSAGRSYRLVPDASTRGCRQVVLERD